MVAHKAIGGTCVEFYEYRRGDPGGIPAVFEVTVAEHIDPNILYDFESRIRAARVIDPVEQDAVADLSLDSGTDEPRTSLPGEGLGRGHDEPVGSLSALINALNEPFGMKLGDADRVWFEQQVVDAKNDEELRVIALNNNRDQYQTASDKRAEDRLIERHQSNGELFGAFYARHEVRQRMRHFIAEETYRYFQDEEDAS